MPEQRYNFYLTRDDHRVMRAAVDDDGVEDGLPDLLFATGRWHPFSIEHYYDVDEGDAQGLADEYVEGGSADLYAERDWDGPELPDGDYVPDRFSLGEEIQRQGEAIRKAEGDGEA